MRLIQEERGPTVATHVYEPGSYVPLARIDRHRGPSAQGTPPETTTNVHYLHTNINGAPEEMTDARGALVWQARYAVWGNTVVEHWHREHRPDPSGLSAHPLPQNLRMQGQYADTETGLCYNTFRYYDPDLGRFISQDPIGLAGGMNLYQYAPNPLGWADPLGLSPASCSGKYAHRKSITHRSASEVNATFPKGWAPPYKPGTRVTEYTSTVDEVYVRVHGSNNKARSWMMRREAVKGLTPEQIKSKYALPETPSHISDVHVPAGTRIRTGIVNPVFGGSGNATQYELLQRLPDSAFNNTATLGL